MISRSMEIDKREAMYEPHNHHRSKRSKTNLASCFVATVFLIFIGIALVIVYFLIFKPKSPRIAVDAVQFPTFAVSKSNGTVNFTFFQFISVTNPNRDAFTHYDSSLQLAYSNAPLGFVFIPSGKIDGGHTQHMSAKFAVQSFPLPAGPSPSTMTAIGSDGGTELGPTMEIETRMKLVGSVRVLKIFTHRVESGINCGVAIKVRSGSVLGFHC